jgi:hypothetical protein
VKPANLIAIILCAFCVFPVLGATAQEPNHQTMDHQMTAMGHEHAASVRVSYEDLTKTATMLETARKATAKYQDVRVAESEGFRAIGPDVPGMGIHFVGSHRNSFDIAHPDILLYEKNPPAPGGFSLVGMSYLLDAESDTDGQPKNPPFPKSLATWHRHSNLCVFPDRSVRADLSEGDCTTQGGHFSALTQWMVHAWIWKDSPDGVFSPTNPNVQ